MTEKVFLNDKILDSDKACISAFDAGFLYGAGLFETMRSCNGAVFLLKDHLDRLFFSAAALSINNTYERKFISEAICELLRANNLTDARIRLTLTSGSMAEADEKRQPTLLITATQLNPYPAEFYKKGVLVILSPYRQNPAEPIYGHKTTSYFSRILALKSAREKGATEALWFTVDNRLAEGCVSNVFLVKDSILYSPPIDTPVLAGIARKTIFHIAHKNSIDFKEKNLYISDLLEADEVFITNVIMQVMPVVQVEKHSIAGGKIGPLTKKFAEKFDQLIKTECGKEK